MPAGTVAGWKACHIGMLNYLLKADGKSGLRKSADAPSVGSQPVDSFCLDQRRKHVLHILSGRSWVTVSKWLLLKFREKERGREAWSRGTQVLSSQGQSQGCGCALSKLYFVHRGHKGTVLLVPWVHLAFHLQLLKNFQVLKTWFPHYQVKCYIISFVVHQPLGVV